MINFTFLQNKRGDICRLPLSLRRRMSSPSLPDLMSLPLWKFCFLFSEFVFFLRCRLNDQNVQILHFFLFFLYFVSFIVASSVNFSRSWFQLLWGYLYQKSILSLHPHNYQHYIMQPLNKSCCPLCLSTNIISGPAIPLLPSRRPHCVPTTITWPPTCLQTCLSSHHYSWIWNCVLKQSLESPW